MTLRTSVSGVRSLSYPHVVGPTCGIILAQLGAEVISPPEPPAAPTLSLGGMVTRSCPLVQPRSAASCLDVTKVRNARRCTGCWRAPTCF